MQIIGLNAGDSIHWCLGGKYFSNNPIEYIIQENQLESFLKSIKKEYQTEGLSAMTVDDLFDDGFDIYGTLNWAVDNLDMTPYTPNYEKESNGRPIQRVAQSRN